MDLQDSWQVWFMGQYILAPEASQELVSNSNQGDSWAPRLQSRDTMWQGERAISRGGGGSLDAE